MRPIAASAAARFDAPEGRTGSPLDAVSARPDFVALIYPVVTMEDPFAHKGSREALLGAKPTPEMIERKHLILFGDPGSNPLIAKVLPDLPVEWTKEALTVAEP